MKITYDLEFLPERRNNVRESEEVTAIKAFLAGAHKNMCFEYDSEKEAKRRLDAVRNFRSQHKLQEIFDLYRIENCIYILRTKKQPSGAPGKKKRAAPSGANAGDSKTK
jgi:hypothetical protein